MAVPLTLEEANRLQMEQLRSMLGLRPSDQTYVNVFPALKDGDFYAGG